MAGAGVIRFGGDDGGRVGAGGEAGDGELPEALHDLVGGGRGGAVDRDRHAVGKSEVAEGVKLRDKDASVLRNLIDRRLDFPIKLLQLGKVSLGVRRVIGGVLRVYFDEGVANDFRVHHRVAHVLPQVRIDVAMYMLTKDRLRKLVDFAAGSPEEPERGVARKFVESFRGNIDDDVIQRIVITVTLVSIPVGVLVIEQNLEGTFGQIC